MSEWTLRIDAAIAAVLTTIGPAIGSSLPVLLGGAGGVLLVWWLDGLRSRTRQHELMRGYCVLLESELSANVASSFVWGAVPRLAKRGVPPEVLQVPPLDLKSGTWERTQVEMAAGLPRDLIGGIAAAYALLDLLRINVAAALARGAPTESDFELAWRCSEVQQAVLAKLQAFSRDRLGMRFTVSPQPPNLDELEAAYRTSAPSGMRSRGP